MEAYRALQDHSLHSRKDLGQHFLVDPQAVARIVDAAELSQQDRVLEVGPGPGTLTLHLAQRAGYVVAVEIDARMLAPLHETLEGYDNVRVVQGDILEQDIGELMAGGPYKVVANLPYYVTSAVLRHVLESAARPVLMVVTVQREVAERIVGRQRTGRGGRGKTSPRMSLLAVGVQFYGVPRLVGRIPAGAFRPTPSVDSAVVRIDTYERLPWDVADEEGFFRVVRAGFAAPRKQLHNNLAHGLQLEADVAVVALKRAGVDHRRRAETLSIEEWVRVSNELLPALRADAPRP